MGVGWRRAALTGRCGFGCSCKMLQIRAHGRWDTRHGTLCREHLGGAAEPVSGTRGKVAVAVFLVIEIMLVPWYLPSGSSPPVVGNSGVPAWYLVTALLCLIGGIWHAWLIMTIRLGGGGGTSARADAEQGGEGAQRGRQQSKVRGW